MQSTAQFPPPDEAAYPPFIGRYRIVSRLGSGGMGIVYQAHDPELNRVVAIKVPRFAGSEAQKSVLRQRFQREARAAATVTHPHVCPIYDVGEQDGHPFVVMAYIDGESLSDQLHRNPGPMETSRAISLVIQILEALAAVHAQGIVHRDLKPGNVMLDLSGRVILTDFGLARTTDGAEPLTSEGMVVGTPAYMAPEQAAGLSGQIGPWTDLYSAGVILYQLATGRLPFEGPPAVVVARILNESPPRPTSIQPGLAAALEAVILRAMARKTSNRYPSARAFGEVLDEVTKTGRSRLGTAPAESAREVDAGLSTILYSSNPAAADQPNSFRSNWRRTIVVSAAVLAAILMLWLVHYLLSQGTGGPTINPFVTRENYVKIKPGMSSWEVHDLLGTGNVDSEDSLVVDANGNFERIIRAGGSFQHQTGHTDEYGGKPFKRLRRTLSWNAGAASISVSFLNDQVTEKSERGLYHQP